MSEAKRQQLTEAGRYTEDGRRINRCPVCGSETAEEITGVAIATPPAVEVAASANEVGG